MNYFKHETSVIDAGCQIGKTLSTLNIEQNTVIITAESKIKKKANFLQSLKNSNIIAY